MECALFRKDYDSKVVPIVKLIIGGSLWNVPCLERITTSERYLVLYYRFKPTLWNVPCLERITTKNPSARGLTLPH